jgi:hypothetical protein
MSFAGDAVFDGALGAGRLLAKGEGARWPLANEGGGGRVLANEEGAGLARELDVALGIDMGMPNAGRGAFCLAAGAAAFQSVFKRSSILTASLSEVFRHRKLVVELETGLLFQVATKHTGPPLDPRHWLNPGQRGGPCQQSGVVVRQTFLDQPIPLFYLICKSVPALLRFLTNRTA